MSKFHVMQKLLIIFVGVALALLGIAAFIASVDAPPGTSGMLPIPVSESVPAFSLAADYPRQPVEPRSILSGVYRAIPYTMIVVVVKSVDERMAVEAGDPSRFKMRYFEVETILEPYSPSNAVPSS